ncbi:hypothetical protein inny_221 [Escherichia phage inny]|nr:hypothetical protein inny_221 [Escherichia phage inny]QXV78274.1 hypothetical protein bas61_0145 [Escherichia phage EmilieFrey]WQN06984.1 hypothetical protein [Escherichia phage vB-Eco-KMB37]CAD2070290.1 hypothetical protein PAULA_0067 [Escherichia phage Paula]HAN6306070.1 hypothetical protein [Escherichia coli]
MKSNIPLSSAALIRFYKAWIANHPAMNRTTSGLCGCLVDYVDDFVGEVTREEDKRWRDRLLDSLKYEMRKQFTCAGLDYNLPFNVDCMDYLSECIDLACHTNTLRLQWVKDRIEDANNACIE